ncbi:glycosyltransferase family 2 protein [soil metagenome]
MIPVSVVIITKNEAEHISGCIAMARLITDDIVVVDNGSTDDTLAIAYESGCRIFQKTWDGYGANKNKGAEMAKYDWILSIDADEIADEELISSLHRLSLNNPKTVYDIKFRSYFAGKLIRFGIWGRDHHIRLFNRSLVKWSEPVVHEKLVLPKIISIKKLNGHLHHYSIKDINEYDAKGIYYAKLCAKKYLQAGKRANMLKMNLSPVFGFIRNYIFYLGLLDGREGWEIAKMMFKNTRRKYRFLYRLQHRPQLKQPVKDSFVVEY